MLYIYSTKFKFCAVICFFSILFFNFESWANDGSFTTKGNHLIPILETQILVKKEILSLKKINNKYIEVSVYYEFFNPGDDKNVTIGFEAFAPEGDVDFAPKNGLHPYMRDFTVNFNDKILMYNVAYVPDSSYYSNENIKSLDIQKINDNLEDYSSSFYYVYYFVGNFIKGVNVVKHTYNYNLSSSVGHNYFFDYVLTAANRWANKQIDDFTLIIDNGEFESFAIEKTFFNSTPDWLIHGIGKMVNNENSLNFFIQKGSLIFQKTNFKINGDLYLYSERKMTALTFDQIPFSYNLVDQLPEPENNFQKKILKNLPFARRGYIFKNPELNLFFNKMEWYIPNVNYTPDTEILSDKELIWLEKWK